LKSSNLHRAFQLDPHSHKGSMSMCQLETCWEQPWHDTWLELGGWGWWSTLR